MRKLLLAGVAVFGSVGLASAQTPAPMPMAPLGNVTAPTSFLGGNNSNNSQGAPAAAGPTAPTPGSFVVHLNGRIAMYASVAGGDGYNYTTSTITPASTNNDVWIKWSDASTNHDWTNANYAYHHGSGNSYGGQWSVTTPAKTVTTTNKLQPQQILGYFRLYPGVDAMATNGMRYGAIVEIRQNFIGQGYGFSSGAPSNGTAFGSSPSGSSSGSTLYVRREAVYLGSNSIGIFRFGQDDGPFSQFDNGVTTFQFGTGAWNGDLPPAMVANGQPTWPFWSGVGKEYAISKAVYLSPSFSGFDLAVSYAPDNSVAQDASCTVAGSGCANLTTSSTLGDEARANNMFEAMARYQGNFSGVGVYGIAGYSGSGNVSPGQPLTTSNAYKGFSVGDFGLVLSYAGFSVGGNVLLGDYNGQVSLEPNGGKSAIAYVVGAQYATGPITLGVSWFNFQSTGSTSTSFHTQRYDEGAAASAVYALAPGINAYAEFLWGQAHQGGINLLGGQDTTQYNTVSSQAFMIGTKVSW